MDEKPFWTHVMKLDSKEIYRGPSEGRPTISSVIKEYNATFWGTLPPNEGKREIVYEFRSKTKRT